MSLLSILTGKTPVSRNIGGYVFDAVISEEHTSELEVTDSPVETGESISDHAYMKPKKLKIVAGVSDVILNPLTRFSGADKFGAGDSRSVTAFKLLQELQETREPFNVQTGLKLYSNMVITSLSVTQDKESAKAAMFECHLREVIIVETQTVKYPPRSKAKQARATKDSGKVQPKDAPKDKPPSSTLNKTFGEKYEAYKNGNKQ